MQLLEVSDAVRLYIYIYIYIYVIRRLRVKILCNWLKYEKFTVGL